MIIITGVVDTKKIPVFPNAVECFPIGMMNMNIMISLTLFFFLKKKTNDFTLHTF